MARQFRRQSMLPETEPGSMSMADLVADEAARVGQSAKDAGDRVARTATGQARQVTAETTHQARDLLEQGRAQLREQAAFQQEKVALRLTTVADELREMAHGASDPVSELARHGAESLDQLACWVKDHQAGELLEEARRFARRRPGVFLLGAALAGVVAGRLTSSGVAAVRQSDDTSSAPQGIAPPSPPPPPASPPGACQPTAVSNRPTTGTGGRQWVWSGADATSGGASANVAGESFAAGGFGHGVSGATEPATTGRLGAADSVPKGYT